MILNPITMSDPRFPEGFEHDDVSSIAPYLSEEGRAQLLDAQTAGAFAEDATQDLSALPASIDRVRTEVAGQGAIETEHAEHAAATATSKLE